ILAALKWFLSNLFIFFVEFNFCGLWNGESLVNAKTVFHFGHKHRKVEAFQPCNTEYPAFVYDHTIKEANGFIECGDCQKIFVVQNIENSNLLLLATEAYCDCSIFPPVTLEPNELRRRPNACYAFHPEENAEECGGASGISLAGMLLLLNVGVAVTVAVLQ
ncbi:hypothetical protein chiPu_0008730, partial [Chiloscyllium punctatum]|nr:hypothetical protein [Chiloscyllium punctatum]